MREIRLGGLLAVLLAAPAVACLWDSDTLHQERSRFPSTLELITGKFLRHSQEFYQWRAADRQAVIDAGDHTADTFDDLAVAFDKLGRHQEAIAVMKQKEELYPNEYETLANLGTFHIHNGDLKEGAKWIAKAIEVNPNAHFGREKFQLLLVQYLLDKQQAEAAAGDEGEDSSAAKVEPEAPVQYYDVQGFAEYVLKQNPDLDDEGQEALLEAALRGVQGMMRFGHYDSPVLLEALGDLLIRKNSPEKDARRLAARAYLRAAERSQDAERERLRKAASEALEMHEGVRVAYIGQQLSNEVAEAEQWYQELVDREKQWIADPAADPEANFQKLYLKEPQLMGPVTSRSRFRKSLMLWIPLLLVGAGIVVATCWRKSAHT